MLSKSRQLTKIMKTQYPLIQGGMAWVSDACLAASVSDAGGLGVIAAGNAPASWVKEQIALLREKTNKPFGLNIMLLSPYVDEIAQLVIDENVPIVITGAGNPGKYMKPWKEAGIITAPVVASSALAIMMEKIGADFVIAEGSEAGGHIGEMTSMVLIPNVVRSVSIPVVAAGGICDANSVAAAFCLGASGVQVGTRFILSSECTAHIKYKEKIIKSKDVDSRVTGRVTGHPVRILRNSLSRKITALEYRENALEEIEKLGEGSLRKAVVEGDMIDGSVMSGQCACLLNKIQTSKEIVQELFDHSIFESICDSILKIACSEEE